MPKMREKEGGWRKREKCSLLSQLGPTTGKKRKQGRLQAEWQRTTPLLTEQACGTTMVVGGRNVDRVEAGEGTKTGSCAYHHFFLLLNVGIQKSQLVGRGNCVQHRTWLWLREALWPSGKRPGH